MQMERTGIDPTLIGDITVGNCLQGGAGALAARTGMLIAGACRFSLQAWFSRVYITQGFHLQNT